MERLAREHVAEAPTMDVRVREGGREREKERDEQGEKKVFISPRYETNLL